MDRRGFLISAEVTPTVGAAGVCFGVRNFGSTGDYNAAVARRRILVPAGTA